jgi:SAM-dependent methyltransferase
VAAAYEEQFLDELGTKPADRRLLAEFAAGSAGLVVDLGCGPGQVGRFVRDLGCTVIGVDVSAAMAELASGRLDGAVVADLRHLPFGNGSVGGVTAFYSLIHLRRPELDPALVELGRVLVPGGRVLLAVHEGRGHLEQDAFLGHDVPFVATLFGLDEIEEAVRRAGLRVTRSVRRAPYPAEHPTVRLYVEAERASPVS